MAGPARPDLYIEGEGAFALAFAFAIPFMGLADPMTEFVKQPRSIRIQHGRFGTGGKALSQRLGRRWICHLRDQDPARAEHIRGLAVSDKDKSAFPKKQTVYILPFDQDLDLGRVDTEHH